MAKKLAGTTKTKITKMFKKGKSLPEIKGVVIEEFPKITIQRIKTVIRQHLEGACDELWSAGVKIRDGGKCIISNKTTGLNSHHLITRKNKRYRWILDNGVTLAADHHLLGDPIAAHGATDQTDRFGEWMNKHRPMQWARFKVRRDNKQSASVDIFDLLAIFKRLTTEIEEIKDGREPDFMARRKVDDGI